MIAQTTSYGIGTTVPLAYEDALASTRDALARGRARAVDTFRARSTESKN
jgi:hypothetical protein